MSWFWKVLTSSVGKKVVAGLTGLGLVGFLVGHLAGNLNLYLGHHALDAYAVTLHSVPGFPLIEAGLLAMFVVHIVTVVALIRENRGARGSARYAMMNSKRSTSRLRSLASRTMALSGVTLLVFLVAHIAHFRLRRSDFDVGDGGVVGLGLAVAETIGSTLWGPLYIVGSLVVGWHVYHGFESAFRSLGVNHRKWTPVINGFAAALAVVIALGFASLPLAAMLGIIPAE